MPAIAACQDPLGWITKNVIKRSYLKALLYLEALIFFGPISVNLVFGTIFLPSWILQFLHESFSNYAPFDPSGMGYISLVWQIATVVCGLAGWVGLIRVINVLSHGAAKAPNNRATLFMIILGLVGLILFNLQVEGLGLPDETKIFVLHYFLPVAGYMFFLYLARGYLFSTKV